MKRNLLVIVSIVLILNISTSGQIVSTNAGGLWNSTTTWIGGTVPGPADSVIINGPVNVNLNGACGALYVTANGVLRNHNNGNYTLSVANSTTNDGTIQNFNYSFTLSLEGNVYQNGIWSNQNTYLDSPANQKLTFTTVFSGGLFRNLQAARTIHVSGDIYFNGTQVDFGNGPVEFDNGAVIDLNGGYLHKGILYGDDLNLSLMSNAFLENITTQSVVLDGTVQVKSNVVFDGFVKNNGTLRNFSNNNYTATMNSGIKNLGFITNNVYSLTLNVSGDLYNEGTWENNLTNLEDADDQTFDFSQPFNGSYLYNNNQDGKLLATSSLSFVNTTFNLFGDTLVFTLGDHLNLSGGVFLNGHISCMMPDTYFDLTGDAFFQNFSVEANNLSLSGIMQFIHPASYKGVIVNNGTLRNYGNSNYALTVDGDFTNNGSVVDHVYNLSLYISGNVTQNGVWSNNTTYLNGDALQQLDFSTVFNGQTLISQNTENQFEALTDLGFGGTNINMDYDTINFSTGDALNISGGYLTKATIEKNGIFSMDMTGDAYYSNSSFIADSNILTGIVQNQTDNAKFYGNVNLAGTLRNFGNSNYSVYVFGNLTNNGIITSYVYSLDLFLEGNIYNNGVWTNRNNYLTGMDDQHLGFTQPFSGNSLINSETDGILIGNSFLSFINTNIDLNGDTLRYTAGSGLALSGGYLREAVVINDVVKSSLPLALDMTGDAYLAITAIESETIHMTGTVQFQSGPVIFRGNSIIEDVFRNFGNNHYSATMDGSVTNNGTITSYIYNLNLYISGDINQNGVWTNNATFLTGDSDQSIEATQPFNCNNFTDNNNASAILVLSNIEFDGTDIDLNGATLHMPFGKKLTVLNGYIIDGSISSPYFGLEMDAASYLGSMVMENPVLSGVVSVQANVTFTGKIRNKGTLRNSGNNNYNLLIDGSTHNLGLIQNHVYSLTINHTGNIFNDGDWVNQWTLMDGNTDQNIHLLNGHDINGQVRFDANVAGATSFTWYKDGSSLVGDPGFSGQSAGTLNWLVPVSATFSGNYHCQTNSGNSRNIFVGTMSSQFETQLKAFLEGPFNGSSMDVTLNGLGYIPLSQPFNTAPWNYNGTESVASLPSGDIVDWVLIELRDAGNAASAVSISAFARQAAFIRSDGTIAGLDGASNPVFNEIVFENLYVVIWHRNHLGIMSSGSPLLTGNVYDWDFTASSSQVYGGALGCKEIGMGIWGMPSGDGNADAQINNSDKNDVWALQAGLSGYHQGDFSMDGQVNNSDKNDIWNPNTGLGSQVPD